MTYPVSVVIPTIPSRREFLETHCLPSVRESDPAQVIVVEGGDNGNVKRNTGAEDATEPYLLFVDDDSRIDKFCLKVMVEALEESGADFAFCGYRFIVRHQDGRPLPKNDVYPGKWSVERLKKDNYIDTTSLIRRGAFPGFDPEILRFQDWDLWLTMAARGSRGVYVPKTLVEKFVIDDGISVTIPEKESRLAIARKHGLELDGIEEEIQ